MKHWRRLVIVVVVLALGWLLLPAPPPAPALGHSQQVLDREGHLLKLTLASDDRYRLWTPLAEISPEIVAATLYQEDQHFRAHPGVNPMAALRSIAHLCLGHRGRGGASTITMQLVRLRYHLHTRSFSGKLVQMWRALELERHASKDQILEEYLNLAPYGGNVEGVGAAARLYFGKAPRAVTRTQAVALCVLPQSPTLRAPGAGKNPLWYAAARRLEARLWPGEEMSPEAVELRPRPPATAPHFVRQVLREHANDPLVRSTLDATLQHLVERDIAAYLQSMRRLGVVNAAALLLDAKSMEVLAQVGSADFHDASICGQVDGTRARRSPGSTLKPFIYASALDQGLIHPLSILVDAPRRFGAYHPENFDGDFAGPLTATDALARSRNVPAVALAARLEKPTFYEVLKRGGVALPREEAYYGLTLPLGGGEVTMEELVRLYAALANDGQLRAIRRTSSAVPAAASARLCSREAAFLTLQMLGHVARPATASPAGEEGIYWKTGTSMGFRDAWSVAVFDHYVLAVWLGNFDGRRNPALVGRTCAGPLLFQIIDGMRLAGLARPVPRQPLPGANLREVEMCAVSGELPTAHCSHRVKGWFIPGVSPITACNVHREILVDVESGLRVPVDDGTRAVRREVYEFWPTDLQALFAKAGLPRRLPPPFAPGFGLEPADRSGLPPRIVSPAPGHVYAMRAGQPEQNSIPLQARSESGVGKLYWFAGKTFLGSSPPQSTLIWRPTPGVYHLTALDDHGRASSSTVTCQAAGL